MRPQQQNRRMRGRNNNNSNNNNNNNNRRGPNPLTRTYESNGPDVKIRGTAQQIAEKYATLARDAQSSGDRVMAENYLQHAEHYNRIIAAAQAQMPIQNFQQPRNDADDEMDEDGDEFGAQPNGNPFAQQPAPQQRVDDGSGPQPVIEGTPAEVALNPEAVSSDGEVGEEQPRLNGHVNHQANGAEGENGGFRRNRRSRRGRGRGPNAEGGDGDSDGNMAQASDEGVPRKAEAPATAPDADANGPAGSTFEPAES